MTLQEKGAKSSLFFWGGDFKRLLYLLVIALVWHQECLLLLYHPYLGGVRVHMNSQQSHVQSCLLLLPYFQGSLLKSLGRKTYKHVCHSLNVSPQNHSISRIPLGLRNTFIFNMLVLTFFILKGWTYRIIKILVVYFIGKRMFSSVIWSVVLKAMLYARVYPCSHFSPSRCSALHDSHY